MTGSNPKIATRTFVAAGLLLAACSREAPIPLPTSADTGLERECPCVTEGRCWVAELADGEGEERGFQCRWVDEAAGAIRVQLGAPLQADRQGLVRTGKERGPVQAPGGEGLVLGPSGVRRPSVGPI